MSKLPSNLFKPKIISNQRKNKKLFMHKYNLILELTLY